MHVCSSLPTNLCTSIPEGQPYRLHLLRALAERFNDPDATLPSLLMEGVPTGIFDELPTSNQWQQRPNDVADDSLDNVQLSRCTGNWAKTERDPELLKTLLQKEIDAGHVKPLSGSRQTHSNRQAQHCHGKQPRSPASQFAMPTHCAASQSMSRYPPHKKCFAPFNLGTSTEHGSA